MIRLFQKQVDIIIEHSKQEVPLEACGYLAGNNGEIKRVFKMTNVDHSPEHFSFDPKEQFKVIKQARAEGLELLAVYHSHPASPARLSEEDIRLANDPNTIYVVYSLLNNALKAFKLVGKSIVEEKIEVIE